MASPEEILQQLLAGQVPSGTPAPDAATVGANQSAPQPPSQPNFLRSMLSDFIGTLSGSLKSGAFQKSVARGVQHGRQRGMKAGDAFVAAFGALPEEQREAEQVEEQKKLRRIQLEQILNQQKRQDEQLALSKKKEERQAGDAALRTKSQLAQRGLKQNEETGEIEPIPEEQLSEEVRARIRSSKATESYRNALVGIQQARLELQQAQQAQNQERIGIAKQNLSARMASLNLAQKQFEASIFGTVEGTPIPGGPTTAEGDPMGLRTFTATKPSLGETQAAASVATGERTVNSVTEIIPKLKQSIESMDFSGYLTWQRALDQQFGNLAAISRGISQERGAQTEQDIKRARALLPSTVDIIIDSAASSQRVDEVLRVINSIVEENKRIMMQQPNVRKVLEGARGKKPPAKPKEDEPLQLKRIS